jgi:hypothetical protein
VSYLRLSEVCDYDDRSRLGASSAGGGGGVVNWTCVLWPEPSTLLSSSSWGELVSISIEELTSVR